MKQFKVLRPHEGDKMYLPGDIREGDAHELKHLVPNVLEPLDAAPAAPAAAVAGGNESDAGAGDGAGEGGSDAGEGDGEGAGDSEAIEGAKALGAAPENKADKPVGRKAKPGARG